MKLYSVAPPINVLVAGLSNLVSASAADIELIVINSKLFVPPLNALAYTLPLPS